MINHSFPGDKFFVFSSHYTKPLSTKYGKFVVKTFESLGSVCKWPGVSGHVLLKRGFLNLIMIQIMKLHGFFVEIKNFFLVDEITTATFHSVYTLSC